MKKLLVLMSLIFMVSPAFADRPRSRGRHRVIKNSRRLISPSSRRHLRSHNPRSHSRIHDNYRHQYRYGPHIVSPRDRIIYVIPRQKIHKRKPTCVNPVYSSPRHETIIIQSSSMRHQPRTKNLANIIDDFRQKLIIDVYKLRERKAVSRRRNN